MERLTQRLAVADKAVATFEEVMRIESPSAIERDAAIRQRCGRIAMKAMNPFFLLKRCGERNVLPHLF